MLNHSKRDYVALPSRGALTQRGRILSVVTALTEQFNKETLPFFPRVSSLYSLGRPWFVSKETRRQDPQRYKSSPRKLGSNEFIGGKSSSPHGIQMGQKSEQSRGATLF